MTKGKTILRCYTLAAKVLYAALSILKDNGKEMRMRELFAIIEKQLELSEWEREKSESTGTNLWVSDASIL